MSETPITFLRTVTVQVFVKDPSTVLQVIVAVPCDTPVTTPEDETVATALLLDDHLTDVLLAFEGRTVALRVDFSSTSSERAEEESLTPVTGCITRMSQVAVKPPSVLFAVITA